MLRAARRLAFIVAILSTSCAAPPDKEMNQAQGAIDAARAAGADKFAVTEFTAATDALKRSEAAVAGGDYRQALNHAIDSRERAQNAVKMAVDGRADARGHAERAIAEVATLLSQAQTQLKNGETARLNAKLPRGTRTTVTATEKQVQEARAALKAEDFAGVTKALKGAASELQAALTEIDAAQSARPAPRKH